MEPKFEYHLWTELIAFEQTDPDRGAARYLDPMPVKPDSVFLFICTADFLFVQEGREPAGVKRHCWGDTPRNK